MMTARHSTFAMSSPLVPRPEQAPPDHRRNGVLLRQTRSPRKQIETHHVGAASQPVGVRNELDRIFPGWWPLTCANSYRLRSMRPIDTCLRPSRIDDSRLRLDTRSHEADDQPSQGSPTDGLRYRCDRSVTGGGAGTLRT